VALRTTCIKVVQDYPNKDRASVCRIRLLQRKPKLGRIRATGWT